MQNIWRICRGSATEELFLLLGCDKKYINGGASDYECFCEFCRACVLLGGNAEAERIALEISKILGREVDIDHLARCDTRAMWRDCCDKILSGEKYNLKIDHLCSKLYVEKQNILSNAVDINRFLSDAVDSGCKTFEYIATKLENLSVNMIFSDLKKSDFIRPNSYVAEYEFEKYINGEKCNLNVIFTEMIFRKIYKNKCQKIQLILELSDNIEYVEALVDYIKLRRLAIRIYLYADENIPLTSIRRLCLKSGDACFLSPILKASACTDVHLRALASIYPIGMVMRE